MRTRYIMAGVSLFVGACQLEERTPAGASARESGWPASFALGRPAAPAELAMLDIDVDGDGHGLPPGSGDATRGAALYRDKCAVCHGPKGEGVPPNPALIGREPREGFPFGVNKDLVRTIGNYWPYASTVFDYIRRAMPQTAPGSLSDSEVYSLTAYLLAANEVIPAASTLDAASLAEVRMPARDRFVRDNRGGNEVR